MYLNKLFSWSYLIERYPQAGFSWPFRIILLIIFIGSIVAALVAWQKLRNNIPPKNVWIRLQTWGWAAGLVGLLLVFFRETRAIYLASRLWLFIWLLVTFIWLAYTIYYAKIILPKIKKPIIDQELLKYLPKKKK